MSIALLGCHINVVIIKNYLSHLRSFQLNPFLQERLFAFEGQFS